MNIKHYKLLVIPIIFIHIITDYIIKIKRTKYISYENKELGFQGKVKVIDVKNREVKNGLHGFIMHAGGAKASDYINFAKKLDIESVRLIDHNNLEQTKNKYNYPKRIYRKIFKLANKRHLINYYHKHPTLLHGYYGGNLFWQLHNEYIRLALEDYHKEDKNKLKNRYIFIGHSHGSSLKAGDYMSKYSTRKPIKVFLMPCLDPNYKSDKYKLLTISALNDTDECAIDPYNIELIGGQYTHQLKEANHFSFLSNKNDQKKVIALINEFIKNNHYHK